MTPATTRRGYTEHMSPHDLLIITEYHPNDNTATLHIGPITLESPDGLTGLRDLGELILRQINAIENGKPSGFTS